MVSKRKFSPYELNQLHKYGFDHIDLQTIGNKPVEYITGHAEFSGLDFFVNEHTLIPRLETEEIVHIVSNNISTLSPTTHLNLVDVATGSGCLGISTAISLQKLGFKSIDLYLTDISEDALKMASLNSSRLLSRSVNVHIVRSDLLQQLPTDLVIDILVSNPPYIPTKRISTLDSSVKDYEPHLALDGGPSGATIVNQLIQQLTPHISGPSFISVIEIDHTHTQDSFILPTQLEPAILKDSLGYNRFLLLKTHNI